MWELRRTPSLGTSGTSSQGTEGPSYLLHTHTHTHTYIHTCTDHNDYSQLPTFTRDGSRWNSAYAATKQRFGQPRNQSSILGNGIFCSTLHRLWGRGGKQRLITVLNHSLFLRGLNGRGENLSTHLNPASRLPM